MDNLKTQAELASDAARDVMRQHAASKRMNGPTVVMPGGRIQDATPYLRPVYASQRFATFMADVDAHPERYLKEPMPGAHYAFLSEKDLLGMGRARNRYRFIEPKEMIPDCPLPWQSHTGPTGSRVLIYDVVMLEVPPKAWEEDFKIREAMAVSQLAENAESFYAGMEERGATAFDMDVQNDPSTSK